VLCDQVTVVEVANVGELERALVDRPVRVVVIDAAPPGQLDAVLATVGRVPVLRPIWVERRNSRGETDRVFGGYGLLVEGELSGLADGELSAG
jgi:hypothetical protein